MNTLLFSITHILGLIQSLKIRKFKRKRNIEEGRIYSKGLLTLDLVITIISLD
jgi:hypothetical protein